MNLILSILAMLHFLLLLQVNAKPNHTQTIKLGSVIYPTRQPTSWSSQSGMFAFGFYKHGNGFSVGVWLVIQPENVVVWTANRDDQEVGCLVGYIAGLDNSNYIKFMVDLWSIGAILFELLNGYPPFHGRNHFQILQNIKSSTSLPFCGLIFPALHPDCVDICSRLLCANPASRLSFDEFLSHRFLRTREMIKCVGQYAEVT